MTLVTMPAPEQQKISNLTVQTFAELMDCQTGKRWRDTARLIIRDCGKKSAISLMTWPSEPCARTNGKAGQMAEKHLLKTGGSPVMNIDIYDGYGPLLRDQGYYSLPIGPGTKRPHQFVPSTKQFVGLTGWQERPFPLTTPQPGAGIGVRCGNGLVAIDYDDEDAALRASEALGDSVVNKAG